MKNVIGMVLALFFILGCSSKHIEVKEDRSFSFPKKSSSVLYHYAKDNIAAQGPKSGYYPLENHLDSLLARIVLAYAATKSIKLQYFTFHSDPAGKLLLKALVDARTQLRYLREKNA
jgi:putative cardiolipin synthase